MTQTNRKNYISIILLNELINNESRKFPVLFDNSDKLLEPFFVDLLAQDYVKIINDAYVPTTKGIEVFNTFMKRYTEYLKLYDVYSYVDLQAGTFAFADYFNFDTDEEWNKFKADKRFEDVRLAVANFKKLNPFEIVFMSFINENRFDTSSTGWQMDLLSDAIWNHIEEIVKTAITAEELGKDAMEDIIKQGTHLAMNLMKTELDNKRKAYEQQQAQIQQNQDQNNGNEIITETYTEEIIEEEEDYAYYEPYFYDPFYVSPFWVAPLFFY